MIKRRFCQKHDDETIMTTLKANVYQIKKTAKALKAHPVTLSWRLEEMDAKRLVKKHSLKPSSIINNGGFESVVIESVRQHITDKYRECGNYRAVARDLGVSPNCIKEWVLGTRSFFGFRKDSELYQVYCKAIRDEVPKHKNLHGLFLATGVSSDTLRRILGGNPYRMDTKEK